MREAAGVDANQKSRIPDVPPLAPAGGMDMAESASPIHRYFELSLYLLTLSGVATLASTGKLDFVSLFVVLMALAIRGFHLLQKNDVRISEKWTNYFTILYVCFYGVDYFLISKDFVTANVHLILFSLVIKLFSVHRERDYLYIALLSFAMVLASAVLAVDLLFLVLFCVFTILGLATATSMEMRRSWAASQERVPLAEARNAPHIQRHLFRADFVLASSIVLVAAGIFFLLPRRLSAGYLSNLSSRSELVTGFSDEVQLGEIGRIQQSDAVMMHVKFFSGSVPADFKLRGVALSIFNGHTWSTPREFAPLHRTGAGFRAPAMTNDSLWALHRGKLPPRLHYEVSMNFPSSIVFTLPEAITVYGDYRALNVDPAGSLYAGAITNANRKYTVESQLPPAMTPEVEESDAPIPAQVLINNLASATVSPRVRELAEQITSGEPTRFAKAQAIEQYLLSNYTYTLDLPLTRPQDPIADFLFHRKRGHCEYFASSMAVMLRSLKIPARVVNGFRGGEYNDLLGSYVIRGKHAHSWVEAYFPDYGWYTFDPTPGIPTSNSSGWWPRLSLYADAMQEFWQDWIVNYDFTHQAALSFVIAHEGESDMHHSQQWWMKKYESWVAKFRKLNQSVHHQPRRWTLWIIGSALLFLLLLRLPGMLRSLRNLRLARKPERTPRPAAAIWYSRLVKLLARRGYSKKPGQTPQEFAQSIASSQLKAPVLRFTDRYERARFGDSAADAAKLPELYAQVEETKG